MDGRQPPRRVLTREEVERIKRRVYDFGMPVEVFMRSKIGAADRAGKPAKVQR